MPLQVWETLSLKFKLYFIFLGDRIPCIRVDIAIQVGGAGAGKGQLFGLKIQKLKIGKLPIRMQLTPYTLLMLWQKECALPNITKRTNKYNDNLVSIVSTILGIL